MRWRSSGLVLIAALITGVAGCTFDDGAPWGEVDEIRVTAALEIPADRLDAQGRIRTSNSYRVAVTSLEVEYAAVSLSQAGAGTEAFDPASPPDGCSLCHNGHCHCDGALVDYADLNVASGAAEGTEVLALAATSVAAVLNASAPADVALESCEDVGCELPRGTVSGVRLDALSATLTVRITDGLTGESARLTSPLEATIALEPWSAIAPADLAVDRDSARRFRLSVDHRLPASLFDGIDWAVIGEQGVEGALETALLDALTSPSNLLLTTF